ncbi:DUF2218 domain-containing protein [Mycobacterium hubeiense]|uniref:DUF2218 domain-containing protein n=1 Tax=Mycobacterium hubeiense TaxID=1867256 RepID=UPI000C7E96FF|nr:DUF2218 domain-containing protein [Mycobacterium sp. QGD 101]
MRHQRSDDAASPTRPEVNHVDYSDAAAAVQFTDGRLTMHATADTLMLRVEAADDDALRRLQDGVAARLQTIGRRDQLTTTWHRLETPAVAPGDIEHDAGLPAEPGTGKRRWPRRLTVLGLIAVGALIVAVHLGIGGAAVAALPWTGWVGGSLLVIILAKLVFIASHFMLGRFAFRRGKTLHARWKARHAPAHSQPGPAPESVTPEEDHG